MAEALNVMIALQTPDGLAFGYVMDASPRHVSFTVNNNLPVGTRFAWRMELKGYSETIMGQLTVTRAYPARSAADWPRFDATIDDIPEEDSKLLKVWMEDQEKGGTSRRMEHDPSRFIKDMFSEGMSGASSAQTKLVIDRINERRARREKLFSKKKKGIGGDMGLSRESGSPSSSHQGSQSARREIFSALERFGTRDAAGEPAEPEGPLIPAVGDPVAFSTPSPARAEDDEADIMPTTEELVAGVMQAVLPATALPSPTTAPPPPPPSEKQDIAAALDALGLQADGSGPMQESAELLDAEEDTGDWDMDSEDLEVELPPAEEKRPPDPKRPPTQQLHHQDQGREVAPAGDDPRQPPDPKRPPRQEPPGPWQRLSVEGAEPVVDLDGSVDPPLIVVRYPTAQGYSKDFRRHLKSGGMFLPITDLGERGAALQVLLHLPSGLEISATALVVTAMKAGTGLMLELTREQQETLASEAG